MLENENENKEREYYYTSGNFSGAYSSSGNNGYSTEPQKPKKERTFGKKIATAVCLGFLLGAAAGVSFIVPTYMANKQLLQTKAELQASMPALSTTTSSLTNSNENTASTAVVSNIQEIANNCLPSVVSITNTGVTQVRTMFGTYQQDTHSSGSGIIIGENDSELLIVTNYHVVSGSNELSVVFSYDEDSGNPSVVKAQIKGYDEDKDLAVIAVSSSDITMEMREKIRIATIGDSSSLALGEQVVAIGNALGYGQSVTTGIISALNREVTVSNDNGTSITNRLIQTDAAINPGNSGGALINMKGELIGINSVKVSNSSVEGMGYAIPISDVQSIIEDLMTKKTRQQVPESEQGYLGLAGQDVSQTISETYGIPVGIYISTVYENSPIAKAGLAKGYVITKFDGQSVKTMAELKNLLTYYRAGETVEIVAQIPGTTGYTVQTYSITLASSSVFDNNTTDNHPSEPEAQELPDENSQQLPEDNSGYNGFFDFFWPFGNY